MYTEKDPRILLENGFEYFPMSQKKTSLKKFWSVFVENSTDSFCSKREGYTPITSSRSTVGLQISFTNRSYLNLIQ